MNTREKFGLLLAWSLLPNYALANLVMPFSSALLPLLPLLALLEAAACRFMTSRWLHRPVRFFHLFFIILLANIVSSMASAFIPLLAILSFKLVYAYIITTLIEFLVALIFLHKKIKPIEMMLLSFGWNLVSYLPLVPMFLHYYQRHSLF